MAYLRGFHRLRREPRPVSGGSADARWSGRAYGADMESKSAVPALEAQGLCKMFGEGAGEVRALHGVDLRVADGEFVAIMGPSGSGKSTLLHILGALDRPSAGSVSIHGRRYDNLDDRALTRLRGEVFGFVFQFFNLLPTLTASENVLLPALVAGERPSRYAERTDELLALVGLTDRAGHLPAEMSGGEQQRVAIARALLRRPEVLLADEPTGNLDSASGANVLALLRRPRRRGPDRGDGHPRRRGRRPGRPRRVPARRADRQRDPRRRRRPRGRRASPASRASRCPWAGRRREPAPATGRRAGHVADRAEPALAARAPAALAADRGRDRARRGDGVRRAAARRDDPLHLHPAVRLDLRQDRRGRSRASSRRASLPLPTIQRVRAVPGVKAASGSVGSIFRTVDSRGKVGRTQSAQVFVAGVDLRQPETTDAKQVAGRKPIEGRNEIRLDADWAAQARALGRRPRALLDADRRRHAARVRPLHVPGRAEPRRLRHRRDGARRRPPDHGQARRLGRNRRHGRCRRRRRYAARAHRRRARPRRRGGHAATKSKESLEQLASLDVVLYFFSGIALFVGMFLILNSFNMTVLQRMREIGTLRALGAAPARVARTHPDRGRAARDRGLARSAWPSAPGWRSCCCARCRASACRSRASHFSVGAAVAAVVVGPRRDPARRGLAGRARRARPARACADRRRRAGQGR